MEERPVHKRVPMNKNGAKPSVGHTIDYAFFSVAKGLVYSMWHEQLKHLHISQTSQEASAQFAVVPHSISTLIYLQFTVKPLTTLFECSSLFLASGRLVVPLNFKSVPRAYAVGRRQGRWLAGYSVAG